MTSLTTSPADSQRRVQIRHVLCPVDRSETSARALRHAHAIADWYNASMTAMEVVWAGLPPIALPEAMTSKMDRPFLSAADRRAVESALQQFADTTAPGLPPVQCEVVEGPVVPSILRRAVELPADLIVIGTHGVSGFDRLVLGSVTEKVLRKASCPVMTIPPSVLMNTADGPYRTILCGVDYSPASINALAYATSLAQETQATLLVAQVIEQAGSEHDDLYQAPPGFKVTLRAAELRLRDLVPPETRAWCCPEEIAVPGRPHEEIVRLANERKADLIVVGVHGRSALDIAFFGSTTNQVIRHASCPVLTVRT